MIPTLDDLRAHLLSVLPEGRERALSAKWLSRELGVSTRIVGRLVEDAILEDGACIGSVCGEHPGYFRIVDAADLEAGVGHTVKRLAASARRVRAVRRNYEALPTSEQTRLFEDLDRELQANSNRPDPMELLSLGRDPVEAA